MKKSTDLKKALAAIQKSKYYKELFNTADKKEFFEPLMGFLVPMMMTVVGDLGPEDAFDFLYSENFKAMCIQTLVHIRRKEAAAEEVSRLAKDLNLKLPKDKHE